MRQGILRLPGQFDFRQIRCHQLDSSTKTSPRWYSHSAALEGLEKF